MLFLQAGNRTVKAESEREAEPEALLRQYTEEYGPTFVYPGEQLHY